MENFIKKFNPNKVKGLMAEKDIKQYELAGLLNISTVSMNHKLNGKSLFTSDEIAKLSEIFDTTVDVFFI